MHMIGFFQAVIGQAVLFKYDLTVTDTRLDGLRNCAGLLHDLLDHKVLVTALFGCGHIPSNRAYFLLNRFAKCVEDLHAVRTNNCNLIVVQNHILTRAANDRGHIGRDHILSVAQTNDQRVVATRCDNFIRSIKRDNTQCVRAAYAVNRTQYRLGNVSILRFLVQIGNQVRYGLGIGLRTEYIAACGQMLTQFQIVFDNAVMDNRNLTVAAQMRMRVCVGRFTMGCPARMTNTAGAVQSACLAYLFLQSVDASTRLDNTQAILGHCRNTGRIITTIFQRMQSFNQDRQCIFSSCKTNNTTHLCLVLQ